MTNWEKVKAGLTAETFTALVSTAWSELGTCDYCPEGCRAFCEKCKAELDKLNDGEPADAELAFLTFCEDKIEKWLKMEADK